MLLFTISKETEMSNLKRKKETWNIEEFMEDLESHMWAQDEHNDDYQEGFAAAIEQIQNWVEKHKNTLEAPNGWEVTFVETRR